MMLRLILTLAALLVGGGVLTHLPAPSDVGRGLHGLLPPPEVVAAEIRKAMPPPSAFGGPERTVQVTYAQPTVGGKGLVVFEIPEIPQPAKQAPATPYLGSLNWINGE